MDNINGDNGTSYIYIPLIQMCNLNYYFKLKIQDINAQKINYTHLKVKLHRSKKQ